MQAAHEGSPVGLDDFGCAEVEELLDEDEHARSGIMSVMFKHIGLGD